MSINYFDKIKVVKYALILRIPPVKKGMVDLIQTS